MKKFFKKSIKRLRILVVTAIARRVYRQAVGKADALHERLGRQTFVITDPRDESSLAIMTDRGYRSLRRSFHIKGSDAPVSQMKAHCWYHTENHNGRDGMSARRKEIARRAFIKDSLEAAGLIA